MGYLSLHYLPHSHTSDLDQSPSLMTWIIKSLNIEGKPSFTLVGYGTYHLARRTFVIYLERLSTDALDLF